MTRELGRVASPFGAGQVPVRLAPDRVASTVCGFCSTGCSLDVHLRDGVAVNLTPTPHYPVNLGMACPKGWEALVPLAAPDRATRPLLRNGRGRLQPVDWTTALEVFVERMRAVQDRDGAASAAFLSTGQITTEEMVLLGTLAKFGMGMVHGDGNTRQCMATAVVAYKESFGFDAPPYTYADLEASDVIVLIGSNLCIAHPILWERVCRNPHDPRIIVVDPRRTETAMAATTHYRVRPKSDLALLYGIGNLLIERGWIDEDFIAAHTNGFRNFAAHVAAFHAERVSAATGLSEQELEAFAATIHEGDRVSFWWTMGVNQSHEGVRTAQAVINLALMTGNIGRPGTGGNSITGQCNAMGSRLYSNTASLFAGRDVARKEDRAQVGGILGVDPDRIPDRAGLAYDQIVDGIDSGAIRALWVIGTNPAHSWVDQNRLHTLLERLDFLVVQDMYATTETASFADLVLPAAGWGEKEGTFINSERRVGLVQRVAAAPGEALPDFAIFRLIASAWGCDGMFEGWDTPEDVFGVIKRLSRGRYCDITGIRDYQMLAELGGVQWPFPSGADWQPERRLFSDGRFPHEDGRARFVFEEPRPVAERAGARYPFVLLTGRGSSADWHTRTRTSKSSLLRSLSPQRPYVEVSPVDARAVGVRTGDDVVVESTRGALRATTLVTSVVAPGTVFVPLHYAEANRLTAASFDPYSRQPSYKSGAVALRPPSAVREATATT